MSDEIGESLVNFVKYSLKGMSKNFINLSKLKFDEVNEELKKQLIEQKIQERPFIYEFYHQFRKYWSLEAMKKVFGTLAYIQFHVNKKLQKISKIEQIPDFLINEADSEKNIAVINLIMANRKEEVKRDFDKLVEFHKKLNYTYLIEIIIGNEKEIEETVKYIENLNKSEGTEIIIVQYDYKHKKEDSFRITYS